MRRAAGLGLLLPLVVFAAEPPLTLSDPEGDDDGPGGYKYPTDPAYKPRSFDLRRLEVLDRKSTRLNSSHT